MKEIFFVTDPVVGQEIMVRNLDLNAAEGKEWELLTTATITAVEEREESEWNPVSRKRVPSTATYVTFQTPTGSYTRRAILASTTSAVYAPTP